MLAVRCSGAAAGAPKDLCDPAGVALAYRALASARVAKALASPPCSTASRASRRPMPGGQGPRPPEALPGLRHSERAAAVFGTRLACLGYDLLLGAALRGAW